MDGIEITRRLCVEIDLLLSDVLHHWRKSLSLMNLPNHCL
jgi:hypothetical protein